MNTYHKIPTVFKRDPATKFCTLLAGQYSTPELEYLCMNRWLFHEKVDGTNIRVMWSSETGITFGGRTDRAQPYAPLVLRLHELFSDQEEAFFAQFNAPTCLYGEGYGAGIQKGGGNYSDTPDFILFDVKVGDWWLRWDAVLTVAEWLDLRVVPQIGIGTLPDMVEITKGGFHSAWGGFSAEGLVARPVVPMMARNGDRIITKLKTCDFQ